MEEPPPAKRPRDEEAEAEPPKKSDVGNRSARPLRILAKKTVKGATSEVDIDDLPATATIDVLRSRLSHREACEPAHVTLVCKGKVLSYESAELSSLQDKAGADGKITVVYLVRKPPGAAAVAPAAAPAASSSSTSPAATAPAAEAISSVQASDRVSGSTEGTATGAHGQPSCATGECSRRVLLLLRHGQCCHDEEGSTDTMKALTVHGHQQAEASARFIAQLFANSKLPASRALLHSTSRRARETAAKLPAHLEGIEVWNADLLRETDPTKNPLRAEEVFNRIFVAPPEGASDTLIVVAHNNINLYLLMRAAGVPIERAAEAWRLFHLQHASITRIDVLSNGMRQVVSVGAAGHIPKDNVTWSNISGPDLVEWRGGGPERHKLSGRTIVLVRQVAPQAECGSRQIEALAVHVKGLSEYMVSGHLSVTCTPNAEPTAAAIARKYKTSPQIFPDSISKEPEAAFLQFFCPPTEHKRDAVVMVADDGPVLYWLLRSLHMNTQEAKASAALYRIGHASISIVQIKSDGAMRVVTVGDSGHVPMEFI